VVEHVLTRSWVQSPALKSKIESREGKREEEGKGEKK
jgi:hypothetical protein